MVFRNRNEFIIFVEMKILFNRGMAIIWILALVLPFWVYFSILKFEIRQVKEKVEKEIMVQMEEDDLQMLAFTRKEAEQDLYWEHSKEFEYKGEMYDVVEKKITTDSVYYWCWKDEEETVLKKKLHTLLWDRLSNDQKHQQKKSELYQILDSFFFDQISWTSTVYYSDMIHQYFYLNLYFKFQDPPKAPPPDHTS